MVLTRSAAAGKFFLASVRESSRLSQLDLMVLLALMAAAPPSDPRHQKAAKVLLTAASLGLLTLSELLACVRDSSVHATRRLLLSSWPDVQRVCDVFASGSWRPHAPWRRSLALLLSSTAGAADRSAPYSSAASKRQRRSKSAVARRSSGVAPLPTWATHLWLLAFELHESWRGEIVSSLLAECSQASKGSAGISPWLLVRLAESTPTALVPHAFLLQEVLYHSDHLSTATLQSVCRALAMLCNHQLGSSSSPAS